MKHVLIVGGGFAGLNAAKVLGASGAVRVTLVDRRNYHLFQPLLYQVATAGLSPADIAAPIRGLMSGYPTVTVLQGAARRVDLEARVLETDFGELAYDNLLVCCGARPSYFGHPEWEAHAPSLKTIPQATEIRRRLLSAFEAAERSRDAEARARLMSFVVIGAGPTGVELAGAIAELSRFTLARDFRSIDAREAQVYLIEAGPRILTMFGEDQSDQARDDLERLGVTVRTNAMVTQLDADGVELGEERIPAATKIWAAGVRGAALEGLGVEADRQGRIPVRDDLSLPGRPEVFVAGDLASARGEDGEPLPGIAPVAMQQGRYVAELILGELSGEPREPFRYVDKGQMATIGRGRAIVEVGGQAFSGTLAWLVWLVVHVYFLVGFKNRLFVLLSWAWSYLTYGRGARLIVERDEDATRA